MIETIFKISSNAPYMAFLHRLSYKRFLILAFYFSFILTTFASTDPPLDFPYIPNNSEAFYPPTSCDISQWSMDEGSGTILTDSKGIIADKTIVGATWTTRPNGGNALSFDGSGDYINLGNDANLQLAGDMTLSMWINPANFSSRQNPWAKAYGGEGTITLETSGALNFYWGTGGGNTSPYTAIGSGGSLALNTWTHIAIVRDVTNGIVKWYFNGVETNSVANTMTGSVSSLPAYIGRGYVSDFAGDLDEVRVFDCALTAAEVADLMVTIEICDNGIDDDGDNLIDEYDPDCGVVCYNDCSSPYQFNWSDSSGGGNTWEITNGETSLTRTYAISGALGTYNVSVTINNPDGQNIDFSNCGTAGNHFYTATCNDPNATADCDGDPGVADGQFSYGCDFLTFGITSDNSNQKVSITYDFEYPSQICNLEIGDIDFRGSSSPILESWQDEIDIVADNMGSPVAINAIVGSKVNVNNNNTSNLNIVSMYDNSFTEGDLNPYDVDGHAMITTLDKVTSITFTYSNGPDDEGQSDDHAIRINGFEFCPTPQEICDDNIDNDGDNLIDEFDPDCGSTCLLTNPYPAFPIDFLNNNTGWIDYSLASNFIMLDNGNGTLSITGSIIDATPVDFGSGINGSSCGSDDAWDVSLTLSDKQDWSTFQGNGGSANVNASCNADISNLDYWNVSGTLIGTGCNVGRTLTITGPASPYRFQLGNGGNSADAACAFGMSTWFEINEGGSPLNADIYGFMEEVCYTTSAYCNQANNSEFDNGTAYWSISNSSTATATFSVDNTSQLSGVNSAFIDITNSTGTNWHTQFRTGPLSIDASKNYNIIFEAKSAGPKVINVSLQQNVSPYTDYYYSSALNISTSAQTFTLPNISVNSTANDALLKFYLGSDSDDIWIDNIRLEEIGCDPSSNPTFDNEVCYLISDGIQSESSIQDTFYTFNYATGAVTPIGPTGTYSIEAMAMDTVNNIIYTVDGDEFGTINIATGQFVAISSDVGASLSGSEGNININDIDGMTFDHANNIIWATERRSINSTDGLPDDLLLQINPNTGLAIPDAFGSGIDYVVVDTPENDLDDIAISENGTLYAISNYGGSGNQAFGTINKTTGTWTDLGDYGIEDVESLAFTATGQLVATTGKDGPNSNKLFTIDAGTGIATFVGSILPANDVEACDCMSGKLLNLQIGDKVFADINADGIQNLEEPGVENITVNLLTGTGSPYLNSLSLPTTTVTDAVGIYNFDGLPEGQYIVEFVLPGGGVSFSSQNLGSDDELDSDANTANGRSHVITLSGSTNDMSIDAGMLNTGATYRDCDDDGQLFVADDNGNILRFDQNTGAFIDNFITGLSGPLEMIAASDDWLYVANADANEIRRYSLLSGVLIDIFDSSDISDPNGITVGPDDNLYFNNDDNDEILKLDISNGTTSVFVASSSGGVDGSKNGIEFGPDGNLYVTSLYTDQILRYNGTTGAFIDVFVAANSSLINAPIDLTFGPNGNLFVVGNYNDKVVEYNGTTGAFITEFVTYQSGSMENPTNLVFGEDGNLYVTSQANNIGVLKYNGTTGAYIENFATTPTPNAIYFAPVPGCDNCTLNVSIDFSGDVCLEDDSQLTAVVTAGSGTYTYNWTGPASFTSTLQTIDVNVNGNYNVTVTDGNCVVSTSAYVYAAYEPFIFTLNTEVCEGDDVTLTVNSSTAVSYLWSSNAGNATTASVTVTPSPPSTTYLVTITNDLGCQTSASATIDVIEYENTVVTGPSTICAGETSSVSPTTGGTWVSSNTSVATIANDGTVYGVGAGNATFIFTNSTTGCESLPSTAITVLAKPTVSITGPNSGCEGFTTNLSPTTGGTWSSSNDAIATVTNAGVVTGISEGTATFTFTQNGTNCSSDPTLPITVNDVPDVSITGPTLICIGSTSSVSPISGGTWASSNTSVATITNGGIITAVGQGVAYFTFTTSDGCVSLPTEDVTVDSGTNVTITGDPTICENETTILTASNNGGTWSSSNTSIATINSSTGFVTAISAGSVTMMYVHNSGSCSTSPTFGMVIEPKPTVNITGVIEICVGEVTSLSTSGSGGYWTSSDTDIAVISSSGAVAGTGAGTATFTYTGSNGCESDASGTITVNPEVQVSIDFNGSQCLEDDSQLSANATGGSGTYTYAWTGPGGFTANTQTINIVISGNYSVVVSDDTGCNANTSAFVYESYEPFIFALNTTVCEGESVTLSINGASATGYQWSANAGNATTQSVTVIPTVPSSDYSVTVTNAAGCTAEATASIDVDAKPVVSVTGSTDLCIGETSQLSPSSGGVWTSSNSGVASVTNSGLVTAMSNGSATFTFESNTTNCVSNPTEPISVGGNTAVTISGDDQICISENSTLTASVAGGTWSSGNINIATIDVNGVVTPQNSGSTTIIYTISSGCYTDGSYPITIHNDPTVSLNGPSTICEGDNTFVNASTSGTWTSSDVSVATISSSGVITGVSGGSTTISFISNTNCMATLSTPITVIDNPDVTRLGPPEICIGYTSTLSPTSGGIWISSNNSVASVTNSGLVTGNAPGTAFFTFIEATNGCVSDETISIQVYASPSINGLGDSELCIGETTNITPSSGGTWASNNTSVATIDNNGIITAVGSGTARFTFTNSVTGCESNLSAPLTVNDKPTINFTGPTGICKNEQTSIAPTSGGQWSSTDVTVATIAQDGTITGVNPGTVSFIFTSNLTGCSSDLSTPLTVDEPTEITVTGPSTICVNGTTNITPSSGGTWSSSNSSIASITNGGVITGHNAGVVTFTFNANTGCTSDPSTEITIIANPITTFTGPSEICIGSTTNLSPSSGGVWTSSNTSVATVANNGLVTAVGFGTAQFTFVDNTTGCESTTDASLSVYNKPVPQIVGDDNICVGFSTYLTPSSGGTWTSSNTSVAVISSSGQVTGISPGTATFTFFETGSNCVSEASDPITVLQKAPVSITGDNTICIGETSNVSPSTGGSWVSNNPSVATVNNSGVVTGVSQGIAKFTFISDSGCESNETSPIIVYGPTSVSISGPNQVCIGDQVQMLPSTGGTWTSNNTSVATINNNGVVTAVEAGVVNFTFVDASTGCTSDPSDDLTVSPAPTTGVNGPTDICIGSTTFMTPSTGGIWTSLDPSIATIQNNGQVTGVSQGTARFVFTLLSTGCVSDENNDVTVVSGPDINFTGPTSICEGETTSISSTNAGTWISTNPQIASITNSGVITGISAGTVRFRFTETGSGCISELSDILTVNGPPSVSVDGPSTICIGSTTTLDPSSGGSWISLNPEIASTTANGVVTGVAEGTAYFVFTDALTGCESDGTLSIDVAEDIEAQITGDSEICTGYTTTLLPNTGGAWTSSNPAVAVVSNFGVVTGKAPGIVTFTFTDSNNGCSVGGTTGPITVSNCINHDFNVALVGQTILGNLNTNDNISNSATYSNIKVTVEKPLGSLAQLTINPDGTYSFVTNKPGKYIYKVSVCLPPMTNGCPSAFLEINVLENVYGQSNPVSNLEYYTTYANVDNSVAGNPIIISPIDNDDCVYTAGCSLDNSSMIIVDNPGNGTVVMSGTGAYTYTPNAGFIGQDTIQYQICESAGNCSTSSQIITVNASNALNSVVASDDFAYTLKGTTKSGNVINNDSDPEGDAMVITQQGSLINPVVIPEGEYYINNDGSFEFTPNNNFSGPLEIIYTVCDDNVNVACTQATLHIQVFDDLSLRVRVYLEGALMQNSNQTSIIDGRPLMRDELRVSPFTGKNYIPLMDPYTYGNELYDNTPDMFTKMGPGLLAQNMEIADSLTVFSVSGPNAIVDWVHVEVRDKDDSSVTIATRSGLLQRDGDVVDLDGVSSLRFQGLNIDSFYICVRHRTHLGVMSEKVSNGALVDFTSPTTPTFNFGTSLSNGIDYLGLSQKSTVKSGYLALWAGDFNSDGQLKFTEPASDINILYGNVLFTSPGFLINYDFTHGYFRGDYNMDGKAKYANPNDDRNFLQAQIIFHPLNTNFISNLDGVIQQVP